MAAVKRAYLAAYNWAVFFGWAQVLYFAVEALLRSGHEAVYAAVERPLQLAQTAAVLEAGRAGEVAGVGHAAADRVAPLRHLGHPLELTRTHILVSSLVISWSITERYSFFGTKELFGSAPSSLLWLRYSSFLVMYPTGISSEVGLIYIALASEKYCIRMPNKWNYSFDYFYASILVLLVYVPGSPHMYTYMLGQRKKALAKSKTA
ncbi:unnamed protein product [Triticum turgidum subsp. durum]|uniref:Very-long-chain (3R)-3-hydroxyacyl-CoA dehydratase n=1 Tax=Triticum turgidum subsp. durum TaxID=4567 RepID=A0A9R1S9V9_TRITD|nr:unnamed protein product [Triticum turgidum subsp. durum]